MRKIISVFAIVCLLVSCGQPKSVSLVKESADHKTKVTIIGKKDSSADPFHVTMSVKSGDIPEGSLLFEVYADDISDKNIRFDWSDSQHAIITFTQSDGEVRIFSLAVSDTNVILAPVNP